MRKIVDYHGFTWKTVNAIGSPDELFRELEEIRELGYAISQGESIEALTGVATPLVYEDEVYGSLAVSGPSNEFSADRIENLVSLLQTLSNNIQVELRRESDSSPPDAAPLNRLSLDSHS